MKWDAYKMANNKHWNKTELEDKILMIFKKYTKLGKQEKNDFTIECCSLAQYESSHFIAHE